MIGLDLIDVSTDVFGGYCPALPAANLAPGAASIAQDVVFPQGAVRQRGGLASVYTTGSPIPSGAEIIGLKTYITPALVQRLLAWDSLGNLYKENPQGTLNLINSRPYQNLCYESVTLFGREYQALFNAAGGFDIPRQYDDTNWDRVSQIGPAVSPIVTDLAWPLTSLSRAATTGIITGQFAGNTSAPFQVAVGSLININGVTADPTFNGQFPVSVVSPSGGTTAFTAWGAYGAFSISSIVRTAGTVTATFESPPGVTVNQTVVVGYVDDPSYNGSFMIASVSGNQVTWAQAGTEPISSGGFLYVANYEAQVYLALASGYDNISMPCIVLLGNQTATFLPGSTITLAGSSVSAWNTTLTISAIQPPIYISPSQSALLLPNPTPAQIALLHLQVTTPGLAQQISTQGLTAVYLSSSAPSSAASYGGSASTALPASSPAVTGLAGPAGNISQGLHQCSLCFITQQSFITAPSPPSTWIASGGFKAVVNGMASAVPASVGPQNIQSRLLLFTPAISAPALTGNFYSLPNGNTEIPSSTMLIPNNDSYIATWPSSGIIDFSDTVLIAGFQANYLFSELELGECANSLAYNSRSVWLGERNKILNFKNLTFDGGSDGAAVLGNNCPDSWTPDATNFQDGDAYYSFSGGGDWMGYYTIASQSGSAIVGKIAQSAFQDYLGVAILQPNVQYSVRARVALVGPTGNLTQGTLHINLYSPSLGITTGGLTVTAAQLNALGGGAGTGVLGPFAEFTGSLMTQFESTLLTNNGVPADLVLQVYVDGTPTVSPGYAAWGWAIDSIEPYPTLNPFNYSTARFSRAFNPESFDSVTGQVQVRPGDGQQLRAGFPLRNNLYLAKDHYLGYVTDDGVNEPASWAFNEVSATVGICGPNAVDYTEEWATFAERSGLYICWGSDPVKITPEIQTDASNSGQISWASINWSAAWTMWVRIDKINKMILIGAPVNGATSPNKIFMVDYKWHEGGEDIASAAPAAFSMFTNKPISHGGSRRWAIWNIVAGAMTFAERIDGTAQPFYGQTGMISQQLDCSIQTSDNGTAINSQYRGYGLPSADQEQGLQLGGHRKLAGFLKARVLGSGQLAVSIATAQRATPLRPFTLSVSPTGDLERPLQVHGERFYTQVGAVTSLAVRSAIVVSVAIIHIPPPLRTRWVAEFQFAQAPSVQSFSVGNGFNYDGGSNPSLAGTWIVTELSAGDPTLVVAFCTNLNTSVGASALGGTASGFPLDPTVWWQMEKLILCVKRDPTMVVRGVSA